MSEQLTTKIRNQEHEFNIDRRREKEVVLRIKAERAEQEQKQLDEIRGKMTQEQIWGNALAQMNKREFFDAISLRYRWQLRRLPLNCVCGKRFEMDHAMSCMTGGYIHRRHDRIGNLFAKFLNDIAHEVCIEPLVPSLKYVSIGRVCRN